MFWSSRAFGRQLLAQPLAGAPGRSLLDEVLAFLAFPAGLCQGAGSGGVPPTLAGPQRSCRSAGTSVSWVAFGLFSSSEIHLLLQIDVCVRRCGLTINAEHSALHMRCAPTSNRLGRLLRPLATILLACCHTITGYSGNSICPYSFQIPNLQ